MEKEARKALPVGPQLRAYPAQFEVRAQAAGKVEVRGYASTTEQGYEMYDMFGAYTEVVRQGAFGKTLAEGADVVFLTNHGGLTMARTKSGTLTLAEDSTGLESVATLNASRADVRDLVSAIEDGDVDEMSFAFRVMRQQWSPDYDERALIELNLDRGDVSAVNFGANPTTSIGMRSFRTKRAADLSRLATELRAGKKLSAATMETLSQVLEHLAQADDSIAAARPLLSDLIGETGEAAADDPAVQKNAQDLAHLAIERMREDEARARLTIGL